MKLGWICPKCKGTELSVCIETLMKLEQHSNGEFETCDPDKNCSEHFWNDDSNMICRDAVCGYSGKVQDFVGHVETDPQLWFTILTSPQGVLTCNGKFANRSSARDWASREFGDDVDWSVATFKETNCE